MAGARLVVLPISPDAISPAGIGTYILAMTLGKCAVITDFPATRGILQNGEEAIIVPMQDPVALCEAIYKAWNNDEYRRRIALKGRSYAMRLEGEEALDFEHHPNVGALSDASRYGGLLTQELTGCHKMLLLDSPGRRFGVPAKLYEYIGAGRPILALAEVDSDVEWVLRESGVPYRIASPRDPVAIWSAFLELLHDPATVEANRAGKLISARFTREHLAGELAGLLDSCLEARTCSSSKSRQSFSGGSRA